MNEEAFAIYDVLTHKDNDFLKVSKAQLNSVLLYITLEIEIWDSTKLKKKKYFISLPVIFHIVLSFIIVSLYVRINYACRANNKAQSGI